MGIESGSQRMRKTMGKPIDEKVYYRAVKVAHHHGLEVRGSFVAGLIGEDMESMMDSLRFAMKLDLDIFQIFVATPYPGTNLYNQAIRENRLKHTRFKDYSTTEVLIRLDDLTPKEILNFQKVAYRHFYLRPKQLFRQLSRIKTWRQIRDLFAAFAAVMVSTKIDHNSNWEEWDNQSEEQHFDRIVNSQEVISDRTSYLKHPLSYIIRGHQITNAKSSSSEMC